MASNEKRIVRFEMSWDLSQEAIREVWIHSPKAIFDRAGDRSIEATVIAHSKQEQQLFRSALQKRGRAGVDWFEEDTGRFFDEEVTATS